MMNIWASEKLECKHPQNRLRELPGQEHIHRQNRKARCEKCGAIVIGYLKPDITE